MEYLYYILVFAGSIALASLLTALLSWRGRESKLTYTIVFLFLSYVFLVAAFQFLFVDKKLLNPIQQWQDLYHQMTEEKQPEPTRAPIECKDKKAKPAAPAQKA